MDPVKYKSIGTGFSLIVKEQGLGGLYKGWAPTAIGYSAQGAFKFGFYEFFKKCDRRPAVPSRGPGRAPTAGPAPRRDRPPNSSSRACAARGATRLARA